jgi:molybdopterin-guanine dinucleotide biosynthesis protein A
MTTSRPSGSEASGDTVPLYILAGGKSKRFESDKARWLRDGVPLIVGVARTLERFASSVTVVAANDGAYDDLDMRTIGDIVAEKGPMGGLLTAIDDCRESRWLFLTACDWDGLKAEWVSTLLDRRRDAFQAVVFVDSGLYEPLFGLYHVSIRGVVSDLIEADRLKMQFLLDAVAVDRVPAPAGWNGVANLNRPPDTP